MRRMTTGVLAFLAGLVLGIGLAAGAAPLSAREGPQAPPGADQQRGARDLSVPGVVQFDETRQAHVVVRLPGRSRIDKLYVGTTGGKVRKGEPLADLSSPELTVAAQNLLDARRNVNRDLERLARDRLRLWGLDDEQIDNMLRAGKPLSRLTVRAPLSGHVVKKYRVEGEYVVEGARLYDVADLSTVWVEVTLPQDELRSLEKGLPARVKSRAFPGEELKGKVVWVSPLVDARSQGVKVRCAVANPREELRPGMFVTAVLAVPADSPPAPTDLVQAKVKAAEMAYKATVAAYQQGRSDADKVYLWSRRLLEARQEQSGKKADQVAALEAHGQRVKHLRQMAEQRYRTGNAPQSEVFGADFYVAEAALWLARAKAK